MVIAKGEILNPAGRGNSPGKATSTAREAIARFVDDNAVRLSKWLDAIAEKDPKQAFEAYMSVVEYHIPKLARSEIENKMSISFEPLVIRQLDASAPMVLANEPGPVVIEGKVE